jgi:pimeloyl-ACP methyl ester carboxylesterase
MEWTNLRADMAPRQISNGVAWREAGKGPPVLLIHGVGLNADAWEPQIIHLSGRRRVFAFDLPGHGQSDPLPDGAKLADYIGATAGLIDRLGLSPLPIVGHSMGAMIALGLALDHPRKVTALVALNAVYCRDPVARSAVEQRAKVLTGGAFEAEAPIARWFPENQAGRLARSVAVWLHRVNPKAYANAYRVFATSDHVHEGRLKELVCRALFITGVSDPSSTAVMSSRMANEAPYGRTLAIPGARHMMHLTHPAEVSNAITAFIAPSEAAL